MASSLYSVAKPKQARSEKTLRRLLEAAERLVEAEGFGAISIADIVREAGSSVGGFYSRFRDKDELLLALHERFMQQTDARLDELMRPEAWEGASLRDVVRTCVRELVDVYGGRRMLLGAFVAQSASDPEMRRRGLRFRQRVIERFCELVLRHRDEIAHPNAERAVELGAQMFFALMTEFLIFGGLRVGGEPLGEEELITELERNFLAYVTDAPTT
ncbi:MAG: TetR/AcrR family transcriptional regulator [Polyangiales bacterium]